MTEFWNWEEFTPSDARIRHLPAMPLARARDAIVRFVQERQVEMETCVVRGTHVLPAEVSVTEGEVRVRGFVFASRAGRVDVPYSPIMATREIRCDEVTGSIRTLHLARGRPLYDYFLDSFSGPVDLAARLAQGEWSGVRPEMPEPPYYQSVLDLAKCPDLATEGIQKLLRLTVLNSSISEEHLVSAVQWFSKTILLQKVRSRRDVLPTVAQASVARRSLGLLGFCMEAMPIDIPIAQAIQRADWSEGRESALQALGAVEPTWQVVGALWLLGARTAAEGTTRSLLGTGSLSGLQEAAADSIRVDCWDFVDAVFLGACTISHQAAAIVAEAAIRAGRPDRIRDALDGCADAVSRTAIGEHASVIARIALDCGAMRCFESIIDSGTLSIDALFALMESCLSRKHERGLNAVARAAVQAMPQRQQTEILLRLAREGYHQLARRLCLDLEVVLVPSSECSLAQVAAELGHVDRLLDEWRQDPDVVLAVNLERAAPEALLWFTRNTDRNHGRLLEYLASSPKLGDARGLVKRAMQIMGYSLGAELVADLSRSAQLLIDSIRRSKVPTEPTSTNLIDLVRLAAWGGATEAAPDILMMRFERAPNCWACGELLSSRSVFEVCADCGHVVCRSGHCQTPHIRVRREGKHGLYDQIISLLPDKRPKWSQEVDSESQRPWKLAPGFCSEQQRRLQRTFGPLEAVLLTLLAWAVWEGDLSKLKAKLDEQFKGYKFAKNAVDLRPESRGLWIVGIPVTQETTLAACLRPLGAAAKYFPWVAALGEPAWCVTPRNS